MHVKVLNRKSPPKLLDQARCSTRQRKKRLSCILMMMMMMMMMVMMMMMMIMMIMIIIIIMIIMHDDDNCLICLPPSLFPNTKLCFFACLGGDLRFRTNLRFRTLTHATDARTFFRKIECRGYLVAVTGYTWHLRDLRGAYWKVAITYFPQQQRASRNCHIDSVTATR